MDNHTWTSVVTSPSTKATTMSPLASTVLLSTRFSMGLTTSYQLCTEMDGCRAYKASLKKTSNERASNVRTLFTRRWDFDG